MRYIVWSIQNLGDGNLPSMEQLSYKIAPYLERAGSEVADRLPSPRTLNVHTPFEFTPRHPKARYIYVARNPRDTCVSYYHFIKDGVGGTGCLDITFDEFFENFLKGEVPYGDYFDHVNKWWDRREDPNVLFLTYEHLMEAPQEEIIRVASFLSDGEKDYASLLMANDGQILKKIVESTSFKRMKEMPVVIKSASSFSCGDPLLDAGVRVNFFRKGVVGDWVNYFSQDQIQRLEQAMYQKFTGRDIQNLWEFL